MSNLSQFYNLYQSTKGATYAQLATEIVNQNQELEDVINIKIHDLLDSLINAIKITEEQNVKIIKQNEEIILLIKK